MNTFSDYIFKFCNAPKYCTCCGTKLIKEGVNLVCPNKTCKAQIMYQITHFVRKMGVEGANQKTLENFGITTYEKLINFSANKKYKSEIKLEEEIYNKIFTKSKKELFCALNFNGLSEILLNKIVDFVGYDIIEQKNVKNTYNFPIGIGQLLFNKFLEDYKQNVDIVNMIISNNKYHYSNNILINTKKKLNGMSICFTGSLNTMSRIEATKRAENFGYEVKSSVSKGLTYLVTNDKNSGSTKNKKAAQLGIKILNEEEFIKLISNEFDNSLSNL